MGLLDIFGAKGLQNADFEKWVDTSLSIGLPNEIQAFCFNLYEDGGGNWSAEIIGAASFDKEDSDWACDEVCDFGTREHPFIWTQDTEWKCILSEMTEHIMSYLNNGTYAGRLKHLEGVAVGFVDGDLSILLG